MAFNADDIWEFPAAAVVAAEAAVEIGPHHAAPAEANSGAILQAAVLQREILALGAILQLPGIAAAAAAQAAGLPAPQENPQVPRMGKLVCLPFLTAVRMGGFSLGEPIPSAVKSFNWDDLRSRRQLL
jgi:hypothetical protein